VFNRLYSYNTFLIVSDVIIIILRSYSYFSLSLSLSLCISLSPLSFVLSVKWISEPPTPSELVRAEKFFEEESVKFLGLIDDPGRVTVFCFFCLLLLLFILFITVYYY